MGFLDKSTITVDAILTKKGREKLAAGDFEITKFAVADDDVDYKLWDINHQKGSNFYGQAIENMPLTEATPDGGKMMRYKLMTLAKNITTIPYGVTNPAGATITITGPTSNTLSITLNNAQQGGQVTAHIADMEIAYFKDADNNIVDTWTSPSSITAGQSIQIPIYGKSLIQARATTITAIHTGTGLTFQKTVSVSKDPAFIL